jgi:hypothetical protein
MRSLALVARPALATRAAARWRALASLGSLAFVTPAAAGAVLHDRLGDTWPVGAGA